MSEETPKRPKSTWVKKWLPISNQKWFFHPDSRHKSKRHPSTHEPLEQTFKPVQKLGPPISRCQIRKTEKRWNVQQRKSIQLEYKQTKISRKINTTSTATNTFSAPPSGPLYRLFSRRRKISYHLETRSIASAQPFADLKEAANQNRRRRGGWESAQKFGLPERRNNN